MLLLSYISSEEVLGRLSTASTDSLRRERERELGKIRMERLQISKEEDRKNIDYINRKTDRRIDG